ncbi:MAG: SH3 domain-containing protein [Kofleriaceae bacterium]
MRKPTPVLTVFFLAVTTGSGAVAAPGTTVPGDTADLGEVVLAPAGPDGVARARQVVAPDLERPPVVDGEPQPLATSRTIYLNRVGATLRPGNNDSRTDFSSLAPQLVQVPPWDVPTAGWNQVVDCITGMFAPFGATVTTVDPGQTPHIEALFAQSPNQFGMPSNVGGVSPFTLDCTTIENSIVLTFVNAYGTNYESICETMTQEIAHSYGLDHQLLASDPMTYLPYNGLQSFKDQTVSCGESSPRACGIQGYPSCRADQNSYQLLLGQLGPPSGAPPAPEDPGEDPAPEDPVNDPNDPNNGGGGGGGGEPADPTDAPVTHLGGCAAGGGDGGLGIIVALGIGLLAVRRRRTGAQAAVLAVLVGAGPAYAAADAVRAATSTTLRSRPTTSARAVAKVKSGARLEVITREKRWAKVRTAGRTGWVPASVVARPARERDEERESRAERAARLEREERAREREAERRAEEREAEAREAEAREERALARRERAARIDREARAARAAEVAMAADDRDWPDDDRRDDRRRDDRRRDDDDDASVGGRHRYAVTAALRVGAGITHVGQAMSSLGAGAGVPDNYTLGAAAATAGAEGELAVEVARGRRLGLAARYAVGTGISGMSYMGQDISMSTGELSMLAVGTQVFADGVVLGHARLGYHRRSIEFPLEQAANPALLPSETRQGLVIGAALEVPRLTAKVGVVVTADLEPFVGVSQTAGLEDGQAPRARGAQLGATVRYALGGRFGLEVSYDQHRASTTFGAPVPGSMREHGGAGTTRADVDHALGAAVAAVF